MRTNNYVWEKDISLNDLVFKQKEEIERLNKELKKYKKHIKDIDKWLSYNTEIGNLYWYDATPFPELKESNSNENL